MSKLIQELAEQAGYEKDMFGVGHWDMPECIAFAELIAKECAGLCDRFQARGAGMQTSECAGAIRKMFEEQGDE